MSTHCGSATHRFLSRTGFDEYRINVDTFGNCSAFFFTSSFSEACAAIGLTTVFSNILFKREIYQQKLLQLDVNVFYELEHCHLKGYVSKNKGSRCLIALYYSILHKTETTFTLDLLPAKWSLEKHKQRIATTVMNVKSGSKS